MSYIRRVGTGLQNPGWDGNLLLYPVGSSVCPPLVALGTGVTVTNPATTSLGLVYDWKGHVAAGAFPGTTYNWFIDWPWTLSYGGTYGAGNGITFPTPGYVYGLLLISKIFDGQTVSYSGNFDVVSGSPNAGLYPISGAANANLTFVDFSASLVALCGSGKLLYPDAGALGYGALSFRFSEQQNAFGFNTVGGNGGNLVIKLYRIDGGLINTVTVAVPASPRRFLLTLNGGVRGISGVTITNDDPGALGFTDIEFNYYGDSYPLCPCQSGGVCP